MELPFYSCSRKQNYKLISKKYNKKYEAKIMCMCACVEEF